MHTYRNFSCRVFQSLMSRRVCSVIAPLSVPFFVLTSGLSIDELARSSNVASCYSMLPAVRTHADLWCHLVSKLTRGTAKQAKIRGWSRGQSESRIAMWHATPVGSRFRCSRDHD